MSLLSFRDTAPQHGRVGSHDDVLTARPTTLKPGIVAVIHPAWSAPGDDLTAYPKPPAEIAAEAAARLTSRLSPGEVISSTADGRLVMRLRREDRAARPVRLQEMAYHAVEAFDGLGHAVGTVDLGVGWARVSRKQDPEQALGYAEAAASESIRQRDLQPRQQGRHLNVRQPRISHWTFSHQILLATIGSIVLPFVGLVAAYLLGIDLSGPLYWVLVGSLVVTAGSIWAESLAALDPPPLPAEPDEPAPRATAVIAAYLPNEADTIMETLDVFLAQEYSGELQVLLAYNTPTPLAVEAELFDLARLHPYLSVIKVEDSSSKAQNVNAALRVAEGEIVGIFDADHHPMPGAFERAWRWIADGADVVQGHCVIRNGDDSTLAKIVAVEFEQIYSVSHPGRAALHGFGIFGGSNGYWRASTLEQIRLRGSFLTEDIEASMRVLAAGGRIVNDPGLISRELAPDTMRSLWKQRMRWAQGWFQVSIRHLGPILGSPLLSLRQKIGATYLLGWREVYPWLVMLVWPLMAFLIWRDGGLDLTSPVFALATLFIAASGPMQTLAAWRLATPDLRRHPKWFLGAAVANLFFYTEFKNLIARVAHLKQLRGEHQWVVTPRTAGNSVQLPSSKPSSDPAEVPA